MKHSNPKFHDHIGKLDNQALMILSTAVDGIKKEFIGEDELPGGETPIPTSARTNDEIRAEMAAIMGSEAFQNPTHKEHQKAVAAKDALVQSLKF